MNLSLFKRACETNETNSQWHMFSDKNERQIPWSKMPALAIFTSQLNVITNWQEIIEETYEKSSPHDLIFLFLLLFLSHHDTLNDSPLFGRQVRQIRYVSHVSLQLRPSPQVCVRIKRQCVQLAPIASTNYHLEHICTHGGPLVRARTRAPLAKRPPTHKQKQNN